MEPPIIIGVAGGSGSGKTTLTRALMDAYRGRCVLLRQDDYYARRDDLAFEQRAALNYDAPEAFDDALLIEHLARLREGRAVDSPVYDFADQNRSEATVRVEPRPVIIVEGILIYADEALCALFDIRLFVDTDADVRILRRIRRDVIERGRSLESVEHKYLTTVKPMHELYVEPSKRRADLVIPAGGQNLVALDMITRAIDRRL
ncbi:uridine kinase [Brevibacterium sp. 5221]|uniref:Uridine kinase n=1 Tax=Brevibacterium rongguiense TaxID=2695267 RepID=A0A6N9H781_9MICO|nr:MULTISPECIES: uridine kinase [Brevibacterium]MYM19890.1 uridine kinase [Brevibacterium rongguiense]WAL41415.1 uridine kinase [Brevibacterium sp. BRM-1]